MRYLRRNKVCHKALSVFILPSPDHHPSPHLDFIILIEKPLRISLEAFYLFITLRRVGSYVAPQQSVLSYGG
jgi:hypothetical protein